jgi:hypothetical protein
MNRMTRSHLKAVACCASMAIVSGLAVSPAHAGPRPPSSPGAGQLRPGLPEIASDALSSRLRQGWPPPRRIGSFRAMIYMVVSPDTGVAASRSAGTPAAITSEQSALTTP